MTHLRPHHLLCIRKFTGHGYDEAFTASMTALVSRLRAHPETEVALISGCDDLCRVCPNRAGSRCLTEEKVAAMDEKVLARLPAFRAWQDSEDTAGQIFAAQWEDICGDCQWFSLCAETERGMIYENERS